jgi:hypothetical protein
LQTLHLPILLLFGVSPCEVLNIVPSFTTSPSSSKTLRVSEYRDTSSSSRASVISIPELIYFLVIAFVIEVLISCLSLVKYILCYLAYLIVCWCT